MAGVHSLVAGAIREIQIFDDVTHLHNGSWHYLFSEIDSRCQNFKVGQLFQSSFPSTAYTLHGVPNLPIPGQTKYKLST